jgi:hypothetical protein
MDIPTQQNDLSDSVPQSDELQTEDVSARILANQISREYRLLDVVEQPAYKYYFGGSVLGISLRLVAIIIFGYMYFRGGLFSTVSFWPILALFAIAEAFRANGRIDAMIEVESLKARRTSSHPSKNRRP